MSDLGKFRETDANISARGESPDELPKDENELLGFIKGKFGGDKEAAGKYLEEKKKKLLDEIEEIKGVKAMLE